MTTTLRFELGNRSWPFRESHGRLFVSIVKIQITHQGRPLSSVTGVRGQDFPGPLGLGKLPIGHQSKNPRGCPIAYPKVESWPPRMTQTKDVRVFGATTVDVRHV